MLGAAWFFACGTDVIAQQPTAQGPVAEVLTTTQVVKGVYFVRGRSNAIFVVGSDGVLLVDTMTAGHADAILQEIKSVTTLPIRFVVNTHFHQDHTGSNEPFGALGIPIVAQESVRRHLAEGTHNARGQVSPPAPPAALPTITYQLSKTLSLPGIVAKLSYAPAGHTDGDTFIWLPGQNVLVAGDLLHTNEYPFIDQGYGGTFDGNMRAVRTLLRRSNPRTLILPGHGDPFSRQDLQNYAAMMERTYAAVTRLVRAGRSAGQIEALQLLKDDRSAQAGGPDNRNDFIRLLCQTAQEKFKATPKQMQAIVQNGIGGPEVLQLQDVAVPEPAANQVLIRVYAAAVNPVDWKMRQGMGPPAAAGSIVRRIPGLDVAGVVEKLGAGVPGLRIGEPVFSMIGMGVDGLNGGYAEYVVAPAANVVAKPAPLSYAQAAGLGTGGLTAEQAVEQAGVQQGQRVLITGAAGGVGSQAAQLAKARGAYVIGTASARHAAYLKSIGVDELVDYTQGSIAGRVSDVDVVIDTAGEEAATQALGALKPGGTFVTVAVREFAERCKAAGMNCPAGAGPGVNEARDLHRIGGLAATGKLSVHIDQIFPLSQAAEAQEVNRAGHTEGKIILAVDATEVDAR